MKKFQFSFEKCQKSPKIYYFILFDFYLTLFYKITATLRGKCTLLLGAHRVMYVKLTRQQI